MDNRTRVIKTNKETIAPYILCFDDLQDYDVFSFKIIRTIMKYFERILVIGVLRDEHLETPIFLDPK